MAESIHGARSPATPPKNNRYGLFRQLHNSYLAKNVNLEYLITLALLASGLATSVMDAVALLPDDFPAIDTMCEDFGIEAPRVLMISQEIVKVSVYSI